MGIVGDEFMKRLALLTLNIIRDTDRLRSWYSVFDYDKMAVGFAKAI